MSDPKIVNVCVGESYGRMNYYIATDIPIKLVYSRKRRGLHIGRHGDFYGFLSGDGSKGEAFAGRPFDISMDDGSKFHCQWNMWSCCPPEYLNASIVNAASKSLVQLKSCYVYSSGYVERTALETWLANNTAGKYWEYERELRAAS